MKCQPVSGFDAGAENHHKLTHHATRNAACHSVTAKAHMPRRGRTGGRRNTKSAVPSNSSQLPSTLIPSVLEKKLRISIGLMKK